ncbi:MAG: ferritin family protein [Desulfobacterales bacterium]|jgi:rubrerythrin|nr:ferritin family protein [Desulfobacterales bacterium]
MSEDRATEILKNAILLEKRGHAFYSKVAQQARGEAVKKFFQLMAEEEVNHVQILSDQFKSYRSNKKFKPRDHIGQAEFTTVSEILTTDLKRQIAAADYEAAAIAAAMAMEKNAIQIYAARAAETQDPDEKELYGWLADWETRHLDFLAKIDRDLTEEIWHDNRFWPF